MYVKMDIVKWLLVVGMDVRRGTSAGWIQGCYVGLRLVVVVKYCGLSLCINGWLGGCARWGHIIIRVISKKGLIQWCGWVGYRMKYEKGVGGYGSIEDETDAYARRFMGLIYFICFDIPVQVLCRVVERCRVWRMTDLCKPGMGIGKEQNGGLKQVVFGLVNWVKRWSRTRKAGAWFLSGKSQMQMLTYKASMGSAKLLVGDFWYGVVGWVLEVGCWGVSEREYVKRKWVKPVAMCWYLNCMTNLKEKVFNQRLQLKMLDYDNILFCLWTVIIGLEKGRSLGFSLVEVMDQAMMLQNETGQVVLQGIMVRLKKKQAGVWCGWGWRMLRIRFRWGPRAGLLQVILQACRWLQNDVEWKLGYVVEGRDAVGLVWSRNEYDGK